MMVGSLLMGGCAAELSSWHEPVNEYKKIDYQTTSFSDYISQMRAMIQQHNPRADLQTGAGLSVLDAVSPFDWEPDVTCTSGGTKKGVLLIHGLSDSPFLMRDVGKFLLEHCYWVRSLLLPGHGTVPGDLLEVHVDEWVEATAFGIHRFAQDVDQLTVAGFSTGGALALHYVLSQSKQAPEVDTLILFSPAIRINTRFAFMSTWLNQLGTLIPRLKWVQVMNDDDLVKYESLTMNAGAQIYALTQRLGDLREGSLVPIPVYVAAAVEDTTIDSYATETFFKYRTNGQSRLRLYQGHAEPQSIASSSDVTPVSILSQSHVSIPVHPQNGHYGEKGQYINCLHYFSGEPDQYATCLEQGKVPYFYGENTKDNQRRGVLRRLTWNPEFESMMEDVVLFLSAHTE